MVRESDMKLSNPLIINNIGFNRLLADLCVANYLKWRVVGKGDSGRQILYIHPFINNKAYKELGDV